MGLIFFSREYHESVSVKVCSLGFEEQMYNNNPWWLWAHHVSGMHVTDFTLFDSLQKLSKVHIIPAHFINEVIEPQRN